MPYKQPGAEVENKGSVTLTEQKVIHLDSEVPRNPFVNEQDMDDRQKVLVI